MPSPRKQELSFGEVFSGSIEDAGIWVEETIYFMSFFVKLVKERYPDMKDDEGLRDWLGVSKDQVESRPTQSKFREAAHQLIDTTMRQMMAEKGFEPPEN